MCISGHWLFIQILNTQIIYNIEAFYSLPDMMMSDVLRGSTNLIGSLFLIPIIAYVERRLFIVWSTIVIFVFVFIKVMWVYFAFGGDYASNFWDLAFCFS
jgi:hypothetical protein